MVLAVALATGPACSDDDSNGLFADSGVVAPEAESPDSGAAEGSRTCAPTPTLDLASEANGIAANAMPVGSAVFYPPDPSSPRIIVSIADFAQDPTAPFVTRPEDYLQVVLHFDQSGALEARTYAADDVVVDIFRDGGASAPTIRVLDGVNVVLDVVEPNRVCGRLDINDGATTVAGAFEATRIEPTVG